MEPYPATARLKRCCSRDFFLAAVLRCNTPLVTALSIIRIAWRKFSLASSKAPPASAFSNFLMAVFTLDFIALFLKVRFSIIFIRFLADLVWATYPSPPEVFYHTEDPRAT